MFQMCKVIVSEVILFGILSYNAILDIRYREIPFFQNIFFLMAGIISGIYEKKITQIEMISGMMIGVFILLIAGISKEAIGYGDAMVFLISGSFLGIEKNCYLLFGAVGLAAIYGGIKIICKKAGRKNKIPFVPFVWLAYIGILFL